MSVGHLSACLRPLHSSSWQALLDLSSKLYIFLAVDLCTVVAGVLGACPCGQNHQHFPAQTKHI
jgi:hypothetical protein